MPKKSKSTKKLLDIISPARLRESTVVREKPSVFIETESDKGRVINCAAFRRLQQKAQVFPLDQNAAVRTRLTHSLEVAQVGRYLAQVIVQKLQLGSADRDKAESLINIVEAACLLHDIGNPPFGHLGESAIRDWFSKSGMNNEFQNFDGNAQGLRIISFLSGKDNFGLNLTATLLLATIKYPWHHINNPTTQKHKSAIFPSSYELYEKCCSMIGWNEGAVFPINYIMDAADDIAYSISDIEDGIEKRIVSKSDLNDLGVKYDDDEPLDAFTSFRTKYIRESVKVASDSFVERLDEIINPTKEKTPLIPIDSTAGKKMHEIKSFAKKKIYTNLEVQKIEIAGKSVISGLLQHFQPLLSLQSEDFNNIASGETKNFDFESRLFNFLPSGYVKKYRSMVSSGISEQISRQHLILDFLSGMTDDYALSTFRAFSGIDIR